MHCLMKIKTNTVEFKSSLQFFIFFILNNNLIYNYNILMCPCVRILN